MVTHLPSRDECLHHRVSGVETAADVIFVVVRINNAYLISRGRHDHILTIYNTQLLGRS